MGYAILKLEICMRSDKLPVYAFFFMLSAFAAFFGSMFGVDSSSEWYQNLYKPSIVPPDYVFGIVWSILYTLITISFFIYINSFYTNRGLILFFIQLFLNLSWPYLFFEKKLLCISLINLVLLNVFTYLTYQEFYKSSNISSYLLIPYMIWISFALYLNSHICFYN